MGHHRLRSQTTIACTLLGLPPSHRRFPRDLPLRLRYGLGGGVLVLPTLAAGSGLTGNPTRFVALQGHVVSILQGGAFFGALFGAPMEDNFGRKYSLMIGCVVLIAGGIVQVTALGTIGQSEQTFPAFREGPFLMDVVYGGRLLLVWGSESCRWSAQPTYRRSHPRISS